jgi:hypothetical protein
MFALTGFYVAALDHASGIYGLIVNHVSVLSDRDDLADIAISELSLYRLAVPVR